MIIQFDIDNESIIQNDKMIVIEEQSQDKEDSFTDFGQSFDALKLNTKPIYNKR